MFLFFSEVILRRVFRNIGVVIASWNTRIVRLLNGLFILQTIGYQFERIILDCDADYLMYVLCFKEPSREIEYRQILCFPVKDMTRMLPEGAYSN